MNAEQIARALGGARRAGNSWLAHCPAHDDRTPSLALNDSPDGKVLIHCHAGCSQADVIAALKARGLWSADGATANAARKSSLRTPTTMKAEKCCSRLSASSQRTSDNGGLTAAAPGHGI